MKFNVPYIPDDTYTTFLAKHSKRLYACHYAIVPMAAADARIKVRGFDLQTTIKGLQTIIGPRKYLLINSRFQQPDAFLKTNTIPSLVSTLDCLLSAGVIDGLVFADLYFLRALSNAAPSIANRIEAVPSINFMMDSTRKLSTVLSAVEETQFKQPDHVPLDRALNRDLPGIERIHACIRQDAPKLKLELLANEGCLPHCPFKLAHDAYIALANVDRNVDTLAMNRDFGCMQALNNAPETLFKSPFIRPEDVKGFFPTIEIIKICGRTLGPEFLQRTVQAYLAGTYEGNLLELTDSMNWLAEKVHINNHELPRDFHAHLSACGDCCGTCTYCRDLFNRLAIPRSTRLQDLRARANMQTQAVNAR